MARRNRDDDLLMSQVDGGNVDTVEEPCASGPSTLHAASTPSALPQHLFRVSGLLIC